MMIITWEKGCNLTLHPVQGKNVKEKRVKHLKKTWRSGSPDGSRVIRIAVAAIGTPYLASSTIVPTIATIDAITGVIRTLEVY